VSARCNPAQAALLWGKLDFAPERGLGAAIMRGGSPFDTTICRPG